MTWEGLGPFVEVEDTLNGDGYASLQEENMPEVLQRMTVQSPQTLEELRIIAAEEWADIPLDDIRNLYQSIPNRIEAVTSAKGDHTKY